MTAQEIERLARVETQIENLEGKLDAMNDKLDAFIAAADSKYVLRAACTVRHQYIDPRQIWGAAAFISIVMPLLTAVAVWAITN